MHLYYLFQPQICIKTKKVPNSRKHMMKKCSRACYVHSKTTFDSKRWVCGLHFFMCDGAFDKTAEL